MDLGARSVEPGVGPWTGLAAMPEARALGEAATTLSDRNLAAVAVTFRVSKRVLLYRLRDTDLITTQRFVAKWAAWAHHDHGSTLRLKLAYEPLRPRGRSCWLSGDDSLVDVVG